MYNLFSPIDMSIYDFVASLQSLNRIPKPFFGFRNHVISMRDNVQPPCKLRTPPSNERGVLFFQWEKTKCF